MARNSEKAMTALARWRAAHLETSKEKERRPFLATECDDLQKAEKFRRQIIGEVSRKVAQIQNAGLGEFKIRDLNDEINKLLREKGHWQDRIKELGGPDYWKIGPKMLDQEGKEVPGNKGYKYFGAAKDLPGVRELFEQEPPKPPRKTRAELMKDIDADYYGYRDEDDGRVLPLEKEAEENARAQKVTEWKDRKEAILRGEITATEGTTDTDIDSIYEVQEEAEDEPAMSEMVESTITSHTYVAHVPVPSQKEVEEALVRRKKQELLERYATDALQTQVEESKKLVGL